MLAIETRGEACRRCRIVSRVGQTCFLNVTLMMSELSASRSTTSPWSNVKSQWERDFPRSMRRLNTNSGWEKIKPTPCDACGRDIGRDVSSPVSVILRGASRPSRRSEPNPRATRHVFVALGRVEKRSLRSAAAGAVCATVEETR